VKRNVEMGYVVLERTVGVALRTVEVVLRSVGMEFVNRERIVAPVHRTVAFVLIVGMEYVTKKRIAIAVHRIVEAVLTSVVMEYVG